MDAQAYIILAKEAVNLLTNMIMDPNNKFTKEHLAKIIPKTNDILGTISQMAVKMANLEGELTALKSATPNMHTPPDSQTPSVCEILSEMKEQNYRDKNLIIHNVPENTSSSQIECINSDISSVKKILSDIDSSTANLEIKIYRLGTRKDDKPRGIKVEFPEAKWPRILLTKKHVLKNNIRFYQDQSILQRKQLTDLRNILEKRKASGETDITIKYINNRPTITKIYPKN